MQLYRLVVNFLGTELYSISLSLLQTLSQRSADCTLTAGLLLRDTFVRQQNWKHSVGKFYSVPRNGVQTIALLEEYLSFVTILVFICFFGAFDLITCILASDADRREATSQESFFPQAYGTFKPLNISETDDFFFFRNGLQNKKCFFFN